jgi:hypothetical protein
MMEAASICVMSVNCYQMMQSYNPEESQTFKLTTVRTWNPTSNTHIKQQAKLQFHLNLNLQFFFFAVMIARHSELIGNKHSEFNLILII